jgi:phosphoribosylformylglycinamidine synthase
VAGRIPAPDLVAEARLHRFLAEAAERRLLRSAHDVADGGLAVTLAESSIAGGIGVVADCDEPFSEGDGRAVISIDEQDAEALAALAGELPLRQIGRVGGDAIVLSGQTLPLAEAAGIYESALPAAVEGSG